MSVIRKLMRLRKKNVASGFLFEITEWDHVTDGSSVWFGPQKRNSGKK